MHRETMTPEPWFNDSILSGLQRLLCLGLEGQPAAEVLPGTALAWQNAIWPGRWWDKYRDLPRIEQAFTNLTRTIRRWPVPAQFFEAMPRYEVSVLKIGKDCPPEVREREMKRVADILAGLDVNAA